MVNYILYFVFLFSHNLIQKKKIFICYIHVPKVLTKITFHPNERILHFLTKLPLNFLTLILLLVQNSTS